MTSKNTKLLKKVREIQAKIKELETERNISIGQLKAARNQLKELNLFSLEDAEKEVARLHREIGLKSKRLDELTVLLDDYAEKLFPK